LDFRGARRRSASGHASFRPDGADTIADTITDGHPYSRTLRNRLANAAAERKSVTIAIGFARLDERVRE
jgi:hypothetical protein